MDSRTKDKVDGGRDTMEMIVTESDIILISCAGLLGVVLGLRIRRRLVKPLLESYWTGHGIATEPIIRRVEARRHGIIAEARNRAEGNAARADRLAMIRKKIGRMSYFQFHAAAEQRNE